MPIPSHAHAVNELANLRAISQQPCSSSQAREQQAQMLALEHIVNGASRASTVAANAWPPIPLDAAEQAVMDAIENSGDPNAKEVAQLMRRDLDAASGPADLDERGEIVGCYRRLLEQRTVDPEVLTTFLYSAASVALNRMQLTALSSFPGIAAAMAAGRMAQSLYSRSWSSALDALPYVVASLPSLRNWEEFDALVRSLPKEIVAGLEALHGGIETVDRGLTPQLDIRQAGPALAVAVLLWQVQGTLRKVLPPPAHALQGVGRFVAGLPGYWQTLVGMNSLGGALLAPVITADGPDLSAPKVRPTLEQKEALKLHKKAFDRGQAIVPPFDDRVEPADWKVPGQPQRGGKIAAPPAAGEAQQHPDAATSPASHPGLAASLIAMVPFLHRAAGFVQVPQVPPPVAMQLMGESALHEVLPTEPLIQPPPMLATAGSAGAMRGFASRYPRTVTAAVATGVAAAAGGVVALARKGMDYFWYSSETAPTLEALVELAALTIEKAPDGSWQSGLSRLEETLDTGLEPEVDEDESALTDAPRAGRPRRDASAAERTTTGAPTTTHAPPTALAPHEQLHVMRLWALAVAQDIAQQPGWEWVARAPESEQELLVTHWHALRQEQAKLVELDAIPGTALTNAMQAQGVTTGWENVEVDLGTTHAAGIPAADRLPLLEYCLARSNDANSTARAKAASFLRGGVPVSGAELQQLRDFAASAGCTGLRAQVNAQVEKLRPALEEAVKAKLVIHALRAKTLGTLGSAGSQLRGGDIVLGFLQGRQDVESSTLTYVDRLADGTEVSIVVPNYLVLRSTSTDPDINGQVVLYRSDLSTFQTFKGEGKFRQFLDTPRAKAGLFADNHRVDQTVADDIVNAADPHLRKGVLEQVNAWEARQALYQTHPHDPNAWDPKKSIKLLFATSSTGLQDWAAGLVRYRQGLEQQRLDQGQLRWSALGIVNSAAEAAYQQSLSDDLQSFNSHANPAVTAAMKDVLGKAGLSGSLEGFDPHQVFLTHNGIRMSLTNWATSGWEEHGLDRGLFRGRILPPGTPNFGAVYDDWPSAEELAPMRFEAYRPGPGDTHVFDPGLTGQLEDEELRRAICYQLDQFAHSDELAHAYTAHLKSLVQDANDPYAIASVDHSEQAGRLAAALDNQIRTRTAWMIEKAYTDGEIDAHTRTLLMEQHAHIDPTDANASSLLSVTLAGKVISGLWAMQAGNTTYVFLPDTPSGDRLLNTDAFKAWVEQDRTASEDYIRVRTLYRHHEALAKAFSEKEAFGGIRVGFRGTQGPKDAARVLIEDTLSNVDELNESQLEQLGERLKFIGAVVVAAVCMAATGGAATVLCVAGALALVAEGIREGVDKLERGDLDGAIESIGGSVLDAVDVLQITAMPALLYRLGRSMIGNVDEALDALRQWRAQGRGFAADGVVNDAFKHSLESLSLSPEPMLVRRLPGGGSVYLRGDRQYIRQGDAFVEVVDDGVATLRLRDPDHPDGVGAPVEYRNGLWRRSDELPVVRGGTTPHSRPKSPDWATQDLQKAENLSAERQLELEALFGTTTIKPTADVHAVIDTDLMNLRIAGILADPDTLGIPGDEAMIMRAWADSALGAGKGVVTYAIVGREWTQAARFGKGPVGLYVKVGNPRILPTLKDLIAASDQQALLRRLQLPLDTDVATLSRKVRELLVETIGKNPKQSVETWQRWLAMQHRLPTAADNLVKHFPALTKAEADELVRGASLQLRLELESWYFPTEIQVAVSNVLANRAQRQQREAVIRGPIHTLAEVNELAIHLKAVLNKHRGGLPERTVVVQRIDDGDRIALVFSRPGPDAGEQKLYFASDRTGPLRPTDVNENTYADWQHGVFDQLTEAERTSLRATGTGPDGAGNLRRAVVDEMRDSPIMRLCRLPGATGGKVTRAGDCAPPTGVSLEPREVAARDQVAADLHQGHAKAETAYQKNRVLLQESEDLKARKRKLEEEGLALSKEDNDRLVELSGKDLMHEKNFRMKNFVAYQMEEITLDDSPLNLSPSFPLQGASYSGPPLSWFDAGDYVGEVPIRRVFVRDDQVEKTYKGKGKQRTETPVAPGDMFREDYAMGADLLIAGSGRTRGSASIELAPEDLMVKVPAAQGGGQVQWVPLNSLDDARMEALGPEDLSPALKALMGDAALLPSNAKSLVSGVKYRVFEIRSCSEGKVLDTWFDAMVRTRPGLSSQLRAPTNTPAPGLAGQFVLVSDMHPCATSCDRRLTALMQVLPNMNIRVYYHFVDNAERTEWRINLMVNREMVRTRVAWDAAGRSADEVKATLHAELTDKMNGARREAAEEDLRLNPPRADEMPVPKLWQPQLDAEEGL